MIIRRAERPVGYYVLDRRVAEDKRLSWEARGLLVYLLVKPDHWQISIANLISQSPAGRDKVYGILRELGQIGYLRKSQERGGGRFVKHYYLIFDTPPLTENPEVVEPFPAKPDMAQPDTANPTLVNNQGPERKSGKSEGRRACALPPEFGLTPERESYARSKGVANPGAEMEAFRAYHQAHGKTMKDWDAAWRTWCIKARQFSGGKSPPASVRPTDAQRAAEKLATDLRSAKATCMRFGLKRQMQGEPDENFIGRIERDLAEMMRMDPQRVVAK